MTLRKLSAKARGGAEGWGGGGVHRWGELTGTSAGRHYEKLLHKMPQIEVWPQQASSNAY